MFNNFFRDALLANKDENAKTDYHKIFLSGQKESVFSVERRQETRCSTAMSKIQKPTQVLNYPETIRRRTDLDGIPKKSDLELPGEDKLATQNLID